MPPEKLEMAVSRTSAPASADFIRVAMPRPVVQWVWTTTGSFTSSFRAFTKL